MKLYRRTIIICSIITGCLLFFVITMGMGWIGFQEQSIQTVFYTVVSAPLGSGTYAVINGIIGYVSAKRNTMLNFYYAVSDFFRFANQYDAEMDEKDKEELLDQSLKEKLFRKIKKAYNEIGLINSDSEIKRDIDGIYAHCVKEEEVIRALADTDDPNHRDVPGEKTRKELVAEFDELYNENDNYWKTLIDIYSQFA